MLSQLYVKAEKCRNRARRRDKARNWESYDKIKYLCCCVWSSGDLNSVLTCVFLCLCTCIKVEKRVGIGREDAGECDLFIYFKFYGTEASC